MSVWEFFWPLLNGACYGTTWWSSRLCLLVKLIVHGKSQPSICPSMLQVFIEEPGVSSSSLRQLSVVAKHCPGNSTTFLLLVWMQQNCTIAWPYKRRLIFSNWAAACSDLNIVPIGRPIAIHKFICQMTILQPVPIGVPGELHIGEVGLAEVI